MYKDLKVLALVPARSGSTRIKDKNMQKVCGVSLIGWAGLCLRALDWIDVKVISTDSGEYAFEGEKHGLEVLMRPPALSHGQHRSIVPTMLHAIDEMQKKHDIIFDIVLLIEPTSPTRTLQDLEGIINLFTTMPNAEAVISVGTLDKRYCPEHILKTDLNDRLFFVSDSDNNHYQTQAIREDKGHDSDGPRSQSVVPYLADASTDTRDKEETYRGDMFWWTGIGYAYQPKALLEQMTVLPERSFLYLIDRPIVNIDNPIDLLIAEQLMRKGADWIKE